MERDMWNLKRWLLCRRWMYYFLIHSASELVWVGVEKCRKRRKIAVTNSAVDWWISINFGIQFDHGTAVVHYVTMLAYKTAKPLLYTVYRTRNRKQLGRKWSGKDMRRLRKRVGVGAEVMSGSRLFQRRFPATGTYDRQQWTAAYVGSLAVRKTTRNRRPPGYSRKDIVAPERVEISKWVQPTWNRCVSDPQTVKVSQHQCDVHNAEKIDVSVWRRRWAPTKVDGVRCPASVALLYSRRMEHRIAHWTSAATKQCSRSKVKVSQAAH